MKRGNVVTVALPGSLGKPRPALVIQSDTFGGDTPTVTLLPLTSKAVDSPLFRLEVKPNALNGLSATSHVQVDKATSPPRGKVGQVVGHLGDATMLTVNRALALSLGLA